MFAERTSWNLVPNALTVALDRFRASGRRLIDLTCSNPTTCGFKSDNEAAPSRSRKSLALSYEPDPRGLLVARRAVAEYYAALGASVDAEAITLTTSTSEAYSFAFRALCDPCDEVLIPEPAIRCLNFSLRFRTSGWSATRSSTITAGRSISTASKALSAEKTRAVIVVIQIIPPDST